jgi:hypothetical protein
VNSVSSSIVTISSLNLRARRNKADRSIKEPFRYYCSFCTRRRTLGADATILTQMHYVLDEVDITVKMCDRCVDVFADCLRYGPKVVRQLHRWERKSKVVRMSLVDGDRFCHMCLGTHSNHVFLKYDDVTYAGSQEHYAWVRVCARCALCYLEMLRDSVDLKTAKLSYVEKDLMEVVFR